MALNCFRCILQSKHYTELKSVFFSFIVQGVRNLTDEQLKESAEQLGKHITNPLLRLGR